MLIQDAVAAQLAQGASDVLDGFPIPVANGARSFNQGWLADIARLGKEGNNRYCYGVRMLIVVNQQGVATGRALASGHVQERWVAELLCSTRAGVPGVPGPLDAQRHTPKVTPPAAWIAAVPSGGAASHKLILGDSGFRGDNGLEHWAQAYDVRVCPLPKAALVPSDPGGVRPAQWSKRPLHT